jgi:hypothetical protein
MILGQEFSPWAGGEGDSVTVWLGDPLLEWTLSQMTEPDWSASAYEVLKRFLGIACREYELLSFGQCSNLMWSTNRPDSIRTSVGVSKGDPRDLTLVAQKCMPGLNALMLRAMWLQDEPGSSLMIPLISLAGALRDLNVDTSRLDLLAKFYAIRIMSAESGVRNSTHQGSSSDSTSDALA